MADRFLGLERRGLGWVAVFAIGRITAAGKGAEDGILSGDDIVIEGVAPVTRNAMG